MEIKKTDPKTKAQFIIFSAVTVGIVLVGWLFSFRDLWQSSNVSFSSGFTKVAEVKNEVKSITSDFKENVQPTVSEVSEAVSATTETLKEGTAQREEALNVVGEMMKENLEQTDEVVESTN